MAPDRVACTLLAGLSSVLFLGGGVVTYFVPRLTPPLYIAGSVLMFANAMVAAGLGIDGSLLVRSRAISAVARGSAVAVVVVVAFWSGYLV